MERARLRSTLALSLLCAGAAIGAPGVPNDFEAPDDRFNRLFAYFGGVANWGSEVVARPVFTGNSLRIDIGFQPDMFFPISGAAIGSGTISGASLNVPSDAQFVSITVDWPYASTLGMEIHLREDDNASGVIESADDDDWVSPQIFLMQGVHVYNISVVDFVDDNPGVGNDVREFTTTGAMQTYLVFETRVAFPGGRIESPVTFHADHLGLFATPQAIGSVDVPGDTNGDGVVNFTDMNAVLASFGQSGPAIPGDLNNDGVVDFADLNEVLANFGDAGSLSS
jgi:hypothetical protein